MRSIGISEELGDYIEAHANPSGDAVAERLAATTRERFGDLAGMNIGLDQGRFMSMLVSLIGARRPSSRSARSPGCRRSGWREDCGDGGRLICFDITDEYLATAREAWTAAGVDDRIEFRLGPPPTGWPRCRREPHIDLAFIDADKPGYQTYLDALLPRLTERGVILVDNVLWSGRSSTPTATTPTPWRCGRSTTTWRARPDCEAVMLSIGDGLTLHPPHERHGAVVTGGRTSVPLSGEYRPQATGRFQHGNHGFDQGSVRRRTRRRSRTGSTRVPTSSATRPAPTPTRCKRAPTWPRTPSTSSRSDATRADVDRLST